jgi:hypothetical protein
MSRSLSWFDPELLRALLSGSGVAVSARQSLSFGEQRQPSTLVGQFGHTSRFAVGVVSEGRFGQAVTKPEPAPLESTPSTPVSSPGFDLKATRLAAGTTRQTEPHPPASRPPPPMPAPFAPSASSSFEEALALLLTWAMDATAQSRAFVADRDGLLLAQTGYGAAPASSSVSRPGAEPLAGAVCPAVELALSTMEGVEHALARGHVLLERADGPLTLVWANAPHGRLYLGLAGGRISPAEPLAHIADALRQLITGFAS